MNISEQNDNIILEKKTKYKNTLSKSPKSKVNFNNQSDKKFIKQHSDEIEEFTEKITKSTKSSKSSKKNKTDLEEKKIIKEKTNKASSQQVNSYKTKAKANAKYIEESDEEIDSEDLEKELAKKSK